MIIPATPDFGHSDFWHFNFAVKFLLGKALHNNYLPFWSKDIGTGFPLFAESQIGIFNILNLITFRIFSPEIAINLGYLLIFLIAISGTYLFCRSLNFHRKTSFFAGFLFGFSGIFVTHTPHFNFIQTAAFLPWIFYATQKIISAQKIKFGVLLCLAISQQFYSGYPQMVMISLIGSSLYFLWFFVLNKSFKSLFIYTTFVITGIILSTPQLLATWSLLKLSPPLAPTTYDAFPYSPINILSFLSPYIFGDPRYGTYPPPSENWGIFWESTGYFGLLPFLLFFVALFKTKKTQTEKALLLILVISLVLMLGKYTPLGIINNFPPFSFFRLPARYLLLVSWTLIIISCSFLNHISSIKETAKQKIVYIFIAVSIIDLSFFAFTYNAFIPSDKWLEKPDIVSYLNRIDTSWYRIHTIAPTESWNSNFMVNGWQDMSVYLPFRNSLDANQNVYWGIPSADLYTRLDLRRRLLYKILIDSETKNYPDGEFEITNEGLKLLSLSGVKYISSPGPIKNSDQIGLAKTYTTKEGKTFWLYQNPNFYPHAYLTNDYTVIKNLSSFTGRFLKNPQTKTVVLESDVDVPKDNDKIIPANVMINEDLRIKIEINTTKKSLLILSDTYYPDWQATIDGKKTTIYPANINQRAVIVEPGKHIIEFKYILLLNFFNKSP